MSKDITRWVCTSQIIALRLNHHEQTVLVWRTNMWLLLSSCMSFHHLPMPVHIWKPILPNNVIQFILWLNIQIFLSCVWYNLYHPLPQHPKVFCVSCNNYIFNIIYLPFTIATPNISEGRHCCMWLACSQSFSKKLPLLFEDWYPGLTPNPLHHTPHIQLGYSVSPDVFSLGQFSSFHHKVIFHFTDGSSLSLVPVTLFWYYELSAPDSMGINTQKPKTNFAHTVTLICFLRSSCMDFSSVS